MSICARLDGPALPHFASKVTLLWAAQIFIFFFSGLRGKNSVWHSTENCLVSMGPYKAGLASKLLLKCQGLVMCVSNRETMSERKNNKGWIWEPVFHGSCVCSLAACLSVTFHFVKCVIYSRLSHWQTEEEGLGRNQQCDQSQRSRLGKET